MDAPPNYSSTSQFLVKSSISCVLIYDYNIMKNLLLWPSTNALVRAPSLYIFPFPLLCLNSIFKCSNLWAPLRMKVLTERALLWKTQVHPCVPSCEDLVSTGVLNTESVLSRCGFSLQPAEQLLGTLYTACAC